MPNKLEQTTSNKSVSVVGSEDNESFLRIKFYAELLQREVDTLQKQKMKGSEASSPTESQCKAACENVASIFSGTIKQSIRAIGIAPDLGIEKRKMSTNEDDEWSSILGVVARKVGKSMIDPMASSMSTVCMQSCSGKGPMEKNMSGTSIRFSFGDWTQEYAECVAKSSSIREMDACDKPRRRQALKSLDKLEEIMAQLKSNIEDLNNEK